MDTTFWIEVARVDLLLRLLIAGAMGGAIGIEREIRGKAAGFRTHLLICTGAALLAELSIAFAAMADNGDPGRIASYVVSGVGFIGGGAILQGRGTITGLTTAASIWVVAAIGLAVGAEMFVPAIGTTIFVLAALMTLGRLEGMMRERPHRSTITLGVWCARTDYDWIVGELEKRGLTGIELERATFEPAPKEQQFAPLVVGRYDVRLRVLAGESVLRSALVSLMELDEVLQVSAE